ncbi:hypothetical protein QAD02_009372, partial [Eretmocerus hayati]
AHLRDAGLPNKGVEATYRFVVNSTAVSAAGAQLSPADRSTRFDMSALLKCGVRGTSSLVCRMSDSRAVSFASANVDPQCPGKPLPDTLTEHAEYQIAEEAFEIEFENTGIGKILVNRTVSPPDLNIIRALANQFNVGANLGRRRETDFHLMERSVIGKCDTHYHIVKNTSVDSTLHLRKGPEFANCSTGCGKVTKPTTWEGDYRLSGLESLGLRHGQTMWLEKWRNVDRCSLRADYFFGSREAFLGARNDFEARIVSSESSLFVSDSNFASYTRNELLVRRARGDDLSVYESYSLSLVSIDAAETPRPLSIIDPATASVYAFQYIDDDEESPEEPVEPPKKITKSKTSQPVIATTTATTTTTRTTSAAVGPTPCA